MDFFSGVKYNIQGLILGLRTPSLLFLGGLRFIIVLVLTFLLSGLILYWHDAILSMVWEKPETGVLLWIWHGTSWIVSLLLSAVSMVISYLVAQLFFCAFIMDYMSRITERMILGREINPPPISWVSFFVYLVGQEIPRAVIPVLISLVIMMAGLLTPVSPVILLLSSAAAGIFLAWDNTDLVPARRMEPFRDRLGFLRKTLLFHLGFGVLFLVPWLNILLLSFAPVGATLYHINRTPR